MKKYSFLGLALAALFFATPTPSSAAVLYSQTITLNSGWNIVSVSHVLESHSFSAAENSTNFDIYVLDASQTSKWATMAQEGQTEFTPLYGYFINNKTGTNQTLTFNYLASTTPNQRLFERTFTTTGWYSFGIANPSYATPTGTGISSDTNNPSRILNSLSGFYDSVVDFTDGLFSTNPDSVAVGSAWKSQVQADINSLHDFRETKGYAVYVTQPNALYSGFQNDTVTSAPSSAVTVVSASSVSATNLSVNQTNQLFGGWDVGVQGESASVQHIVFNLGIGSSHATSADVTNVTLVDGNGSVLAGPVDASNNQIAFNDTVTFPVGTTTVYLKGKLGTNFANNDTVQASTTPSTQWTSIIGQTTGNAIVATSSAAVTSAQMTVKTAVLGLSVGSTPIAQTVIAGTNQFTFTNLIFDATASSEDIRVTTVPARYTFTGNSNDLTNCQLYNGSTSVSDQHVYNPAGSISSPQSVSFTLNSGGVVVPKGTTVTFSVKCDVRSGSTGTYAFGIDSNDAVGAAGVSSGSTVNGTLTTATGNTMTASTGGVLTVALDAGSPSYGVVSAGSTGVELGRLRFSGTNEAIDLRQLALVLTSGSRTDLVNNQLTLWDATTNTQIATAVLSSNNHATSSVISSGAFRVPSNGSRVLIVKGDIAAIGNSGPLTASGDLLKVNYDGNNVTGTNGTYAVGVSSGQNIQPTSASTAVNGVTIYKSYPTFTYSTVGGVAINGNQSLLTLTVSADSRGDVTINKLTFAISTSTATLTSPTFTGPNGSVASTTLTLSPDGTSLSIFFDSASNTSDAVVAAGTSKSYILRGTIALTGTNNTGAVTVALKGDTAIAGMGTVASLGTNNIIWSPQSTTTTSVISNDWTNGYGLGGCFATSGLGQDCFANVLSK